MNDQITIAPLKSFLQTLLAPYLYKRAYSRAFFTLWGVVIKETSVGVRQFFTWKFPIYSFYHTLAVILSSFLRLLLGRSVKYSFAFTGEDLLIQSILAPRITENGFYVDVGCNHPIFLSNTYLLYRKGWRGICVDANKTLIRKFSRTRPRDIAVCALVSNKEDELPFYLVENEVLSTIDNELINLYQKEGLGFTLESRVAKTLTSILDEHHAPLHFDLLSIDVEEHDYEVLLSLDLTKYRPRLILLEDEHFNLLDPTTHRVYRHLTRYNYRLHGFVLKNMYFIEEKNF